MSVLAHTILNIFFCKQKTAYEMRMSDWSSDVCSSDLKAVRRKIVDAVGIERVALLDPRCRPTLAAGEADELDLGWPAEAAGTLLCGRRAIGPLIGLGTGEIGRASCRERVCKSV